MIIVTDINKAFKTDVTKVFNVLKKIKPKRKSVSKDILTAFSRKFAVSENAVELVKYKIVKSKNHAGFAGQIAYLIKLDGEPHIGRYFSGEICTDKIADKNYSGINLPRDAL